MGGATVEALDTLRLGHIEGIAEERSVVVVIQSSDPLGAIKFTTDVTGVIHHRIISERGYRHLLDFLHGEVYIGPVLAVIGMAVEVNLIDLVVGAGGIVHEHYELIAHIRADEPLIEALWGVSLCGDSLAIGIT